MLSYLSTAWSQFTYYTGTFSYYINTINPLFIALIFLSLFFVMAYHKMSIKTYSLLFLGFLSYLNPPSEIWVLYFVLNGIFAFKPLRRRIITSRIMKTIVSKNLLPSISPTEKVALDAGNSWVEAGIFSGSVDYKAIFNSKFGNLSQEEVEFLNREVEEVCVMATDDEIFANNGLTPQIWSYLREKGFFGLNISKDYGGLGFSVTGQSCIVAKLASRSQVLAITAMVPNSLGPAELIAKYGTDEQKTHYLPRLANGTDIPCFGLTEPHAGSDAASIKSHGIAFKDKKGNIKIRLNFSKRYITLGAVATVIGLAFKLEDPDGLLVDGSTGITCALVKGDLKGVTRGRVHNPLGVPFVNSPISGVDVEIGIEDIIGAESGCGKGWKMLMECLSIGRGISLPSVASGGAQLATRYISAYTQLRKQFNLPLYKFEGIQEKLALIYTNTYAIDAIKTFMGGAVDMGFKPSVANAIAKHHTTEMYRDLVNASMDVVGGAGICMGERNLLANGYIGAPIAITVEGSNIVTRSLMEFGQGIMRSHPFLQQEVDALNTGDLDMFDRAFWAHVGHVVSVRSRMALMYFTRGNISGSRHSHALVRKIQRKVLWCSNTFAFLSETALIAFGAQLKRKEYLSGQFADVLSHLFTVLACIRKFQADGLKKEEEPILEYIFLDRFTKIEAAMHNIYKHLDESVLLKFGSKLSRFFFKLNHFTKGVTYKLIKDVTLTVTKNSSVRDNLTSHVYIPENPEEQLTKLEVALDLVNRANKIVGRIKDAEKAEGQLLTEFMALEQGIISESEFQVLKEVVATLSDVVQVDDYFFDKNSINGKSGLKKSQNSHSMSTSASKMHPDIQTKEVH